MGTYKVTSRHAEEVASGETYGPDDLVTLTSEEEQDDFNRRLIVEGFLTANPTTTQTIQTVKE